MVSGRAKDDVSGILVVDKETGMTSHDVVDLVRRRFGVKKAGHAGTLDPAATGVLVILIGSATRLSQKLSGQDKSYRAVMKLGERTDSGDSEGKIIAEKEVSVDAERVRKVVESFRGDIEQIPPMFSAKKIKGKKLYQLARKGAVVERPPVKVTINDIGVTEAALPEVEFYVDCGKGTYIRQLADDIGEKLGCGAHLTGLRRISSGNFHVRDAVSVTELSSMSRERFYESVTGIQESP